MPLARLRPLGVLVIAGLLVWGAVVAAGRLPNATPAQQAYLTERLGATREIVIRDHPAVGGRVRATLTDPAEIARIVDAMEVQRVAPYCTCHGGTNLEFTLPDGRRVLVNYSRQPGHRYLAFTNPWKIQAAPTPAFEALVTRLAGPQPDEPRARCRRQ